MSLKYAILGLLEEQPYYGYEIKQKFEQMMGDLWPVSYGQLYPTLRKLAKEELVTMETVQGKKAVEKNVYSITPNGRKTFLEWLQKRRKKVQHSIKDEFTLSFFFLDRLSQSHIDTFLRAHLDETAKRVHSYTAEFNRLSSSTPFYKKVLMRKMLYHLEAEQKWLQSVLEDYDGSLAEEQPVTESDPAYPQSRPRRTAVDSVD
jgi:DNA-binding PadR family transcriptional regulator